MTDNPKYKAAIDRFLLEPEALTDEDINALKGVDDLLASRAITKRREMQTKSAEARHRAALGEPPQKRNIAETVADATIDHIRVALAEPRHRIKTLEAANATLQQQMQELRDRLVEVEAQRVIADVNASH